MQDLYLKFPDQATADALLFDFIAIKWNDQGEPTDWRLRRKYQNTDVIGVIYEGGEWDAEGNPITPPVALEGWHVNVRIIAGEDGTALDAYQVYPTHPRRVWA